MRRYRGTLALLGLAALLGLYFVFIETPRQQARVHQQEREGLVLSLKEDEVTKLEIETPADRLVLERGEDGAWRMSAPISAAADDGTVRRLLTQLASLSVVRAIDDVGDPAALGLDNPMVRVIAHRAEGPVEVTFGDENPVASGVYVQRGDHKVFLTATSAKATFEVSRDDVRRKEFVDFKPESVTEIDVSHHGRSMRLRREDGEWRMGDPSRTADPDTVSSLLSRLRALRATGFADTVEQRDALHVRAKPRTRIDVTAGDAVVRVAFHQAEDGSLYVRAGGETLYRVNESVVDGLPLDAASLRDMRMVRLDLDDVRDVEVERGSERYRVTRRDNGWDLDGRALAKEGGQQVDAMIRSLISLRGQSVAAETPAALPAKLFASSATRVTLRGADDRRLAIVTISDASGEQRYAYAESSGPVFLVASRIADEIPSISTLAPPTSAVP